MIARDVKYGSQIVTINGGTNRYIRLSASERVIVRDNSDTVFANVDTGRVKIVSRNAECGVVPATATATA